MGGKNKKPKVHSSGAAYGKKPKVDSRLEQSRTPLDTRVTFSFDLIDDEAERFPYHHGEGVGKQILEFLRATSRQTWRDILRQTSGRGLRNHFQEIPSLETYAQERLAARNLTAIVGDDLFRFRFDGPGRLWGHVANGVFYPIWWDERHEVYPVP